MASSRAGNEGDAPFGGHLDAYQCALQRDAGAVPIDIWIVRCQALLGTSQRVFGALQIDFFRAFGGFRKNSDTVRKDLGKSTNDRNMPRFLTTTIVIAELADPQLCHQRRVPR